MANFWQSLKNNWNNGNILKWTQFGAKAGLTGIMTYGAINSILDGKSIFGCNNYWGGTGCCHHQYPNLNTINSIMARNWNNPMGIVGDPMAQMYLNNSNTLMNYTGTSPMMGMYSNNM